MIDGDIVSISASTTPGRQEKQHGHPERKAGDLTLRHLSPTAFSLTV
jgi:hypothetical protein